MGNPKYFIVLVLIVHQLVNCDFKNITHKMVEETNTGRRFKNTLTLKRGQKIEKRFINIDQFARSFLDRTNSRLGRLLQKLRRIQSQKKKAMKYLSIGFG